MSNEPQVSERIAVLTAGQDAPAGYEIARILATGYEMWHPGTNYTAVYTVALRPVFPGCGKPPETTR